MTGECAQLFLIHQVPHLESGITAPTQSPCAIGKN